MKKNNYYEFYKTFFDRPMNYMQMLTNLLKMYNSTQRTQRQINLAQFKQNITSISGQEIFLENMIEYIFQDNEKFQETLSDFQKMISLLLLTLPLERIYTKNNIKKEIFYDTLSDLILRINLSKGNGISLEDLKWLSRIYRLSIFKLGELQFEFTHFIPDTLPDDMKFTEKAKEILVDKIPILSVHIMQGSYIDPYHSKLSFDLARNFKLKFFPDFPARYFYCYSWLLNPNNYHLLRRDSNILRFANLFNILGTSSWPDMALERIFGSSISKPTLSSDSSSLQKKAAQNPELLGVGVGIISI